MDTHVSPLPRDMAGNSERAPGPGSEGHPDAFASQLLNAMLSLFSGFFRHFICGSIRLSALPTGPQLSRRIFKD